MGLCPLQLTKDVNCTLRQRLQGRMPLQPWMEKEYNGSPLLLGRLLEGIPIGQEGRGRLVLLGAGVKAV